MIDSALQPDMALPAQPPRLRLDYLDGLRGLAALVVVLMHTLFQSNWDGQQHPVLYAVFQWALQGRASVAIFIVLSGYCLMLPVAQSPDGTLRGGAKQYLQRRARRILPPYYAALLLFLMLEATVPRLTTTWLSYEWSVTLPAFTASAILSHLFLVQNLNPHWGFKIDAPMWSVGTEWQIYFFLPFLLMPVWKRFGMPAVILVAFVVGLGPYFLTHRGYSAAPWFLGLFALGMAGACVNFRNDGRSQDVVRRVPWGTLAAALFSFFAFVSTWLDIPAFRGITHGNWNWTFRYFWALDILVGCATACLLVFCTEHLRRRSEGPEDERHTPRHPASAGSKAPGRPGGLLVQHLPSA